ncbi:MAG TPA: pyridoxal-phosphate dependent enzyme [Verrucomicrobiae bacterium]|nr:pyridoxal-phosphate dependent enzyme [Verrucomicrobiae bacterium]
MEKEPEKNAPFRPVTLLESTRLSHRLGVTVTLASETFQHTGSFKFRAAYHLAAHVPQRRLLTASSGNFGQALAYSCQLLNKSCIVVMPQNSARVKVDAVRSFGAEVELIDTIQISRQAKVAELARLYPEAYVASPYDDPLVIAGNASLGRELAAQPLRWKALLAPVGGGGLTAGLITGLRAAGDQTPVIGVEPILANDAAKSLRAGHIVANEQESPTLADGVRTLSIGVHNWQILKEGLAGIIEVTEEEIVAAVRLLFTMANLKVEPTGALGIAALLHDPDRFRNRSVCCVVSGGNVDFGVLAKILG